MSEAFDERRARIEALSHHFGLAAIGESDGSVLHRAWQALDAAGLLGASGSALLSAEATLQPGPVYFLGLNPGGNVEAGRFPIIAETMTLARFGCNAFAEDWSTATHTYPPGQSPLQLNFKRVCRMIGLDHAEVPASNLVFARSRNLDALPDFASRVLACFPVHRLFLDAIRPRILWLMGDPRRAEDVLDLSGASTIDGVYGGKRVWHGTVRCRDRPEVGYRLFHTPHMRYWWPANGDNPALIRRLWLEAANGDADLLSRLPVQARRQS